MTLADAHQADHNARHHDPNKLRFVVHKTLEKRPMTVDPAVTMSLGVASLPSGRELMLRGVDGREALSTLYSFELLVTEKRDGQNPMSASELQGLLGAPAVLQFDKGSERAIHGVIAAVNAIEMGPSVPPRYQLKLVPSVSLMSLSRVNRVYTNKCFKEMIESVFARYNLQSTTDYKLSFLKDWSKEAKLSFAVQHEESDWNFAQRWLEKEGCCYWFEMRGEEAGGTAEADREVVVVGDDSALAPSLDTHLTLHYRDRSELPATEEYFVWGMTMSHNMTPARVVLEDYAADNPKLRVRAKCEMPTGGGFGTVHYYDELFHEVEADARDAEARLRTAQASAAKASAGGGGTTTTTSKGDGLALQLPSQEERGLSYARLRAERLQSPGRVLRGTSNCERFRPGYTFSLSDSPFKGKYLITEVSHEAGTDTAHPEAATLERVRPYRARFCAIAANQPYRPPQRARQPRIHGVTSAHVISEHKDGVAADLDEAGRYKVRLPFDGEGHVICRVRMAQAHAGLGHGVHHPLRAGAEVLVAFLGGNPDRPVIVGAVPNALSKSPTTATNSSQSVTQTAAGIRIELEDRETSS